MQLAEAFSVPPSNQRANGGSDQSSTVSHGFIHSSFSAHDAHHVSGSESARSYTSGSLAFAWAANSAGGGNVCSVASRTSSSGSLADAILSRRALRASRRATSGAAPRPGPRTDEAVDRPEAREPVLLALASELHELLAGGSLHGVGQSDPDFHTRALLVRGW